MEERNAQRTNGESDANSQEHDVIAVDPRALPPIPEARLGRPGFYPVKVERNTQTEPQESRLSPLHLAEKKAEGGRKDAPANALGRALSPRRKKRACKVEPHKKKHCCHLFEGPPPKPERRRPPDVFVHPGQATSNHGGLDKRWNGGTRIAANHRRADPNNLLGDSHCPILRAKPRWEFSRRFSPIPPIRRKGDQGNADRRQNSAKKRDPQKRKKRDEKVIQNKNDDRQGEVGESDLKEEAVQDVLEIKTPCCKLGDAPDIPKETEEGTPVVPDAPNDTATLVEKQSPVGFDGDIRDDVLEAEQKSPGNDDEDNNECPAIRPQIISDDSVTDVDDKKTNPMVPEEANNHPANVIAPVTPIADNVHTPHESDTTVSGREPSRFEDVVCYVSVGVQTECFQTDDEDAGEIILINDMVIGNDQLLNGAGNNNLEEELAVGRSLDECDLLINVENEQNAQNGSKETLTGIGTPLEGLLATKLTMNRGTNTPVFNVRIKPRSASQTEEIKVKTPHNADDETFPCCPDRDENTTPPGPHPEVADRIRSVAEHILSVPGLGRMSMPIPSPAESASRARSNAAVAAAVSISAESPPGVLIEDSGGDNNVAALTESRVSIHTLGQGDQWRAMTSTPVVINSPQPDNDADEERPTNQSRAASNLHPDDTDEIRGNDVEDPEEAPIAQTADVQSLIDNLIAARLFPDSTFKCDSPDAVPAKAEEKSSTSPQIPLFTLTDDEITDHRYDSLGNPIPFSVNHHAFRKQEERRSQELAQSDTHTPENRDPDDQVCDVSEKAETTHGPGVDEASVAGVSGEVKKKAGLDMELRDAFLAMEDAVAAAKLIIRYLGLTDSRLRAALHRTGPCDDQVHKCLAAERVAKEAHAFAARTQSVFMTYYRLAEAEDTFRDFALQQLPGTDKERRILKRWWTSAQPKIDEASDESSDDEDGPEP